MPQSRNRTFTNRFPGPFNYHCGRDGVDETFDVVCETTNQTVASSYYWYQRLPCELIARVISEALNASHRSKGQHDSISDESLSDLEIAMFRGMHFGPYRTTKLHCDYRGDGYEVVCKSSGNTVITIHDRQDRMIARRIATVLNSVK